MIEKLTQDESFIRWVKDGSDADKWELFIQEHPSRKREVEMARQIINSFSVKSVKPVDDEMYAVWKKIEHYYILKQSIPAKYKLFRFLKYAAVFLIALIIGAGLTYRYYINNEGRFARIDMMTKDLTEAKIIMADGDEVVLKEKQSELEFSENGEEVKIDKDTVVAAPITSRKNALTQIIIPYGKRSKVLLSDGTVVWMNAGSHLLFPPKFEGKHRKVYLKGEAYFDVVKDKSHPFIVSTNNISVEVLGTAFNVCDNMNDNEVEVVLVEGEISLKENSLLDVLKEEVRLRPRQKAIFDKMRSSTTVESNIDTEFYTSWKEGVLIFNKASILSVFKRLSRYYNVQFVADRTAKLNSSFTGKLDLKESLDDVLRAISDAAPINYRIDKDKIYITTKIQFLPMK